MQREKIKWEQQMKALQAYIKKRELCKNADGSQYIVMQSEMVGYLNGWDDVISSKK